MAITGYHLGCTSWGLKEWVGTFYTDDASRDDFLSQYASVFNTVEGNTTFYNVPSDETVKRWGEQTPKGFKFCFKFHRSITHYSRLKEAEEQVPRFLETFDPIADRLGPFHIQLPPQFSPDDFDRLEALMNLLPSAYSYALEVRHPEFFDRGRVENRLVRLLESFHVDRVIFDTRKLHSMSSQDPTVQKAQERKPKVPVRFNATGSRPFVRFVGANDPLNNQTWLKEWAIIVADWIRDGLHPYVFTHSPDQVGQPPIARSFHRMLSQLIDIEPMPVWPCDRQDEQLDLF